MSEDKDRVEGYRQQSGKLPFPRPGSGGSRGTSDLRDEEAIAGIRGSGEHKHDDLVTGSAVGRPTALVDGRWKVTGQAQYGDCLLYTSPSPRDRSLSRMPSSA